MLRTFPSPARAIARRRTRPSSPVALLAALALAGGCGKTSAPAAATSSRSPSPPSSSGGERAPASPPVVPLVLDDCYRDLDLDAPSSELLLRVAERCAPGMQPLAPPGEGELRFDVADPRGCVRAFAVADAPQAELSLALAGAGGELRTSRASRSRVVALPEAAALCLDAAGSYRLDAHAEPASRLMLGVWQAR